MFSAQADLWPPCPACGSTAVMHHSMTLRDQPGRVRRVRECRACQYQWVLALDADPAESTAL